MTILEALLPETLDVQPTDPYQNTQPNVDQALLDRVYRGYSFLGADRPAPTNIAQLVSNSEPIQPRIDAAAAIGGGVVQLAAGSRSIGPVKLQIPSNVLVRGAKDQMGNLATFLVTENELDTMVQIGGGSSQGTGITVSGNYNSTQLTVETGTLTPGFHVIGTSGSGAAGGAVIKVIEVSGRNATLEAPLFQTFTNWPVQTLANVTEYAGIADVVLDPRHDVNHMVLQQRAVNCWVQGCQMLGRFGLVRSALESRLSYRLSWLYNRIDDAKHHGDDEQGWGMNPTDNSTLVLMQGNAVWRMRHSTLFHSGAAGCIAYQNSHAEPLSTDSLQGGPVDASFHGMCTACGFIACDVGRIGFVTAGSAGPNNVIAYNTVRLSYILLRDATRALENLIILGNEVQSDITELSARLMASLDSPSPNGPADSNGNPQYGRPSNPYYWWR